MELASGTVLDFPRQPAIVGKTQALQNDLARRSGKGCVMGMFMKEYDIYIESFLELLNLRFAPRRDPGRQ